MLEMLVTKRNGETEELNPEKINRVLDWACEGLDNVSMSDVAMNAKINFFDKITTIQIHELLIKSAAGMISLHEPNYQYVAARLLSYHLRKQVWGHSVPPRLYEHIRQCVKEGVYDQYILDNYSKTEIHKLSEILDHSRDEKFTYSGLQQLVDKYLIKNRNTGKIYETPQFAYLLIGMTIFAKYPKNKRFEYIEKFYNYSSGFKINLPTPIMAGVRTNLRQFASCVLINCGDSLDSIFASVSALGRYTAQRAGIGLDIGQIRPINSPIRGGEVVHTGQLPFLKVFEATTKSCTQNAVRGGGGTIYTPWWHFEIQDVMVLKNNAGTDDNRVRKLDYCVQFEKVFYERLVNDEYVTLLSPHECIGLYDSFGLESFREIYERYEQDETLKFRKKVKARDLALLFSKERLETGRIYIMNIDNANANKSFKKRVNMSNLCCLAGNTKVYAKINNNINWYTLEEISQIFSTGEDIYVASRNLETEQIEYKLVLAAAKTGTKETIELIDNHTGRSIELTLDHLVWLQNKGWTEAQDVHHDDQMLVWNEFYNKGTTKVNNGVIDVYDLTVRDNHNFYANGTLVHNCEVIYPVEPIESLDDEVGRIGTCILSGINALETSLEEVDDVAEIIVRMLDELIDYQGYPVKAAELFTKEYRALGVGINNIAGLFAKHGVKWGDKECLELMDEYAERHQYALLKASNQLAKEKGPCELFEQTTYADGILPLDRYNKNVDSICDRKPSCDWELLRESIMEYGIRNATLTCQQPFESSSVIQNSTNGCEPVRSYVSYKKSKQGLLPQLIPNPHLWENYELAYDIGDNKKITNVNAVMQKWLDMSISTNHYYDYTQFENEKIPIGLLLQDMLYMYKMGLKTLYYTNTNDGDKDDVGCASGACST